ncbi:MAG: hypothetical protein HY694_08535 [Deltaproteobacteria bacterium]|nr:hypothetical protein [Deltaproteobacteria bacterium]
MDGVSGLTEDFLSFPNEFVEVSGAGRRLALVYELTAGVHPEILDRVDEFLRSARYDTAVREASILAEQSLRAGVPNSKHQSASELINKIFAATSPTCRQRKLHATGKPASLQAPKGP